MNYPWFSVLGVELEYMVVDNRSADIRPIAEEALRDEQGVAQSVLERGDLLRNNELVRHVVEINLRNPVSDLRGWEQPFFEEVQAVNASLAPFNACLMPGPMHFWMDPKTETELWPFENAEWYQTFDRIFNCRRHGWANLQSMHLNFPFSTADEFARLHSVIRGLLPLIPALSAASPFADGEHKGVKDGRMDVYRANAVLVPEITGRVVPEPAWTIESYQEMILDPLYAAISPHDPDGILQEPWLNARGAITRFDRGSIEIRVIDSQECVSADFAVAWILFHVVKYFCLTPDNSRPDPMTLEQDMLCDLLVRVIKDAENTLIENADLCAWLGVEAPMTAGELWRRLIKSVVPPHSVYQPWIDLYCEQGTLASRLLSVAGISPSKQDLQELSIRLCSGLQANRLFSCKP